MFAPSPNRFRAVSIATDFNAQFQSDKRRSMTSVRSGAPPRIASIERPVSRPNEFDSNVHMEHGLKNFVYKPKVSKFAQEEHDESYITATDAASLRNCRNEPQNKAFHSLMMMLQKKIRTALTFGFQDVLWSVPKHHIDLPVYNARTIAKRIKKKMKQNGFYSKYLGGGCLYISWRHVKKFSP